MNASSNTSLYQKGMTTLAWLGCIFFAILAFGLMIQTNIVAGGMCLFVAITLLPPLRAKLSSISVKGFNRKAKAFYIIVSLVLIGATSDKKSSQTTSITTSDTSKAHISSDLMKDYVKALINYQNQQNSIGKKVAQSMAGLQTGVSSMREVRDTIKDAIHENKAAWDWHYVDLNKVPNSFSAIDLKVRKSYELRLEAYTKYLQFYEDGNTAHISTAESTFRNSEILSQEATREATLLLKQSK